MSTAEAGCEAHAQRVAAAQRTLREAPAAPLALAKPTSNLFRHRRHAPRTRLDLRGFHEVLGADPAGQWVDVEGMTTYEQLVAWCLPRGVMPAVVPQLKTITVGGAVAGVGIEATSFRAGLVHHTMRELEVLLPGGEVVTCTPDNAHRDLFHGFPNSYGCLGYALRVRLATVPVQPCVHVTHRRFDDADAFFAALQQACAGGSDFVEGVAFGARDLVLSTARFVVGAPWVSDYGYENIYWQSLRQRGQDWLSTADWLWRWDTDWFWCSSNFGAQHRWVRRLLGRERLNSRTYTRWMRLAARVPLASACDRARGLQRESVVQDVDLPLARAPEFLAFLQREVGIQPVWICPMRGDRAGEDFPLYPLRAAPLYVNFGFWGVQRRRAPRDPAYCNRQVEREVIRLGGIKSLYSDSFFTRDEFARAYGGDAYRALKERYDPAGRAPDLYEKCVARA